MIFLCLISFYCLYADVIVKTEDGWLSNELQTLYETLKLHNAIVPLLEEADKEDSSPLTTCDGFHSVPGAHNPNTVPKDSMGSAPAQTCSASTSACHASHIGRGEGSDLEAVVRVRGFLERVRTANVTDMVVCVHALEVCIGEQQSSGNNEKRPIMDVYRASGPRAPAKEAVKSTSPEAPMLQPASNDVKKKRYAGCSLLRMHNMFAVL